MLDERLSLAASLYQRCALGADIGTDHALLPAYLLAQGICGHMILADVSAKALQHAQDTVTRLHLEEKTTLVHANGLDALDTHKEPCGCVSITGMGGNTLSKILLEGQHKLREATLVLSAHTEQPTVRQTLLQIGYHLSEEKLCYCAGRWYILWRAEPGAGQHSALEIRYGTDPLYDLPKPTLEAYLTHRIQVLKSQHAGMMSANVPNTYEAARLAEDIVYYQTKLEALK